MVLVCHYSVETSVDLLSGHCFFLISKVGHNLVGNIVLTRGLGNESKSIILMNQQAAVGLASYEGLISSAPRQSH